MTRHALAHPFDFAACFSADYAEARGKFLATARDGGEALATDVAWIGSTAVKRVLTLQSATHGVEGFAGSGAILDFLRAGSARDLPSGVAVMLIHAINPHGFAWLRRVTEEGVDLNRNFVDFSKPLPENPGHDELVDAFAPRELSGPVFEAAEARIAAYRAKVGELKFRAARSSGQYRHPHGFSSAARRRPGRGARSRV